MVETVINLVTNTARVAAAGAVLALGTLPVAAKNEAMTFNGIVRHVSGDNIKVYDPTDKKTVGFAIAPKFKNVFKKGSKTTQLSAIHPGQYVKIYYDRKLLGVAHADRIYLLDQANVRVGKQ